MIQRVYIPEDFRAASSELFILGDFDIPDQPKHEGEEKVLPALMSLSGIPRQDDVSGPIPPVAVLYSERRFTVANRHGALVWVVRDEKSADILKGSYAASPPITSPHLKRRDGPSFAIPISCRHASNAACQRWPITVKVRCFASRSMCSTTLMSPFALRGLSLILRRVERGCVGSSAVASQLL